jgi:hypothetical protein
MLTKLKKAFPNVPDTILWKTDLLFRGVRYSPELTEAVAEGAAENFWPYTKRDDASQLLQIPVPYLFRFESGSVARVRVDDTSDLAIARNGSGDGFWLCDEEGPLCSIGFTQAHRWRAFRTSDGLTSYEAGVEQLGDMLVVNMTPGCEYHRAKDDAGESMKCSFCAYGRFGPRSTALGQIPGQAAPDPNALRRLREVLAAAAGSGEVRHVYITGGSMLSPEQEAERFVPVVESCRRAVGDKLTVTCGSGAVDRAGSQRFRDAGADSCCYNLETWDAATFRATLPGKSASMGRERWIEGLLGAVEVFGWGRVASAFVAGIEMLPPGPGMTVAEMRASIREGAAFFMDRGVMPLYSPLWPVTGTAYRLDQGLQPEVYLQVELDLYRLRVERRFPVPSWLICPGCSYMLLEVDFDQACGGDTLGTRAALARD